MSRQKLPKSKSQKGQASIMIAMMTLTFVFFFIFVVNTGVLVNAKINLQNAADMAAYAGASVQARFLNNISFLNYEMRRQYKKFLFRYTVLGTKSYSPQKVNSDRRIWSLNGEPADDFRVPAVCFAFGEQSNPCQVARIKGIKINQASPFDSIGQALAQQLERLEAIRQDQCQSTWVTNQMVLAFWLFNTDPELKDLDQQIAATPDVRTKNVFQTVQRLSVGLGLVPKLMILRQRIKTLEQYINQTAESEINFGQVQQLKGSQDPAAKERTIQAFLSAFYTLGSGDSEKDTFPGDQIRMTELLPGRGTNLIRLNTIETGFEAYYVFMDLKNPVSGGTTTARDCAPRPVGFQIGNLPIGVFKNPDLLTYYGVKLQAAARLPFMRSLLRSREPLILTAYSAAQPFGSRIGPPLDGNDFIKPGVAPQNADSSLLDCNGSCKGVPNLKVLSGSNITPGGGDYFDTQVLKAYDSVIPVQGGSIQLNDGVGVFLAGMAPTKAEAGNYNILNDFPYSAGDPTGESVGSPFMKYFTPESPFYSVWAPLTSLSVGADDAANQIAQMIEDSMKSVSGVGDDSALLNSSLNTVKENLKKNISAYINRLRSGAGEDGEGFNVARLRDPFRNETNDYSPNAVITNPSALLLGPNDVVNNVNNSWNTFKKASFSNRGRLGYSVKFVAFDTLRGKSSATSNGQSPWTNTDLSPDSSTTADLDSLKH